MGCGASKSAAAAQPQGEFDDPSKGPKTTAKGNAYAKVEQPEEQEENTDSRNNADTVEGAKALILPSGWLQKVDPHSGHCYYSSPALQKTLWSLPPGTTTVSKVCCEGFRVGWD